MMNNKRIHDRQETNKNLKFIMLSLILIIMMYIFREKIYNVDTPEADGLAGSLRGYAVV